MKNIVLACDTYLPKASPNGICVSKVARALSAQDHKVSVVTTLSVEGQSKFEHIDGIPVYRVEPGYVVRALMQTEGKFDVDSIKRRKRALAISRISGALHAFRYPLTAPVQVKTYYRCFEELHKTQNIDVLVCCYHKIAAVAAGLKFKKKHPEVKVIVYTLDAISGGLVFPVMNSMKIPMDSLKRWEKRIFSTVDKAFVMESHRSHYSDQEYDKYREKIEYLDIPLIATDRLGDPAQNEKNGFVYTGLMAVTSANPQYFLPILEKLGENCVFDIYGDVTSEISDMIEQSGIGPDKLVRHGRVPYDDIDGIQRNADILVNFGNANPCMIPCKIFEYISTGKKILSFTHSRQDSSLPYLEKYPNALIVDENGDFDENLRMINEFIRRPVISVDKEMLETLYEKNTAEYFCKLI